MAVEKRQLTRDMTSRLRLRPSAQARALDVDARVLVDGPEDHLVGPPTKSDHRRYN
jgi:hypothetical protein